MEEPLIDHEKEEDYEFWLHISTFVLEETPAKDTNRLQITIIPPTAQRGSVPIEKHVTKSAEESINPVQ